MTEQRTPRTVSGERPIDVSAHVGFRGILRDISTKHHCRISCRTACGGPVAPETVANARVVIRVWSVPTATARTTCVKVFEHGLPEGTRDAFEPAPGFETLMDPHGVPYAQVVPASGAVPAHVYVLFNLFHASFYGLADLMRTVFHTAIPYVLSKESEGIVEDTAPLLPILPAAMDLPSAPRPREQEGDRQYRWQHERSAARGIAVSTASDAFAPSIAMHGDVVREGRDRLQRLASAFGPTAEAFETIDRRSGRSHELALAALAAEYDRIAQMPIVERVEITDRELIVRTRTLKITEDGITYDIGCWEIRIPRDGIDVLMFRIPHRITHEGWQHPHVDKDGKICWGNVQEELTRSLRDAEFDVAVAYLLSLLTTGKGRRGDWEIHMNILQHIGTPIAGGAA